MATDAMSIDIPLSDDPPYLPRRFNVVVNRFFSGGFAVTFEKGGLIVRNGALYSPATEPLTPSPEAWLRFWNKLDAMRIWSWQKSYWKADVVDGTQWKVEIEFGAKWVKCEGANSFPLEDGSPNNDPSYTKTFIEFEKAVAELCSP